MKILNKIISSLKETKIVVVCDGLGADSVAKISQVLRPRFSVLESTKKMPNIFDILVKDVLIIGLELKNPGILNKLKQILEISKTPILVATNVKENLSEDVKNFIKLTPQNTQIILNYDNEDLKKLSQELNQRVLTFGFGDNADMMASDIKETHDTNFKISYKGNIVPVWQQGVQNKERIYSSLAASCVGIILGLNLVQISEALKK